MSGVQLSPRQRLAIEHRLMNPAATVEATAAHVGISARTLRRWDRESAFQVALASAIDELYGAQRAVLMALYAKGLRVLSEAMDAATWPVRVKAAACVIGALPTLELADLVARIDALEEHNMPEMQ